MKPVDTSPERLAELRQRHAERRARGWYRVEECQVVGDLLAMIDARDWRIHSLERRAVELAKSVRGED